jgi:excisionase family DNA binding protein
MKSFIDVRERGDAEDDPKPVRPTPNTDTCESNKIQANCQIDLHRAFATGNFTTAEAAYFLGVSPKTIWNWRCDGRIQAMTLGEGRSLRFHINELNKFLRG